MRRATLSLVSLLVGCAPGAATGPHPAPCPTGTAVMVRDVLYFGRSIPGGGSVSDTEWTRFVAEVITPAFPQGFTITTGTGQWQEAGGNVVSEPSMIFSVLHPDTQVDEAKITGIGERYRVLFHQEAVLHEHLMACMDLIDGKN
jgi:hypothetical protein